MNTRRNRLLPALSLAAISLLVQVPASAQTTTTFTYQGALTLSGAGNNDPADFRFRLYNAAENGAQVGPQVEVNNLTVTRGLFSASLDFGAVFSGASLWLEIEARSPAGTGTFTVVTPRQRISPTPRALFATTAASATTANTATTAGTANFATSAGSASTAGSATTATTATTALSAPWSGITGVPPNVALSPWSADAGGIFYQNKLVIGTNTPDVPPQPDNPVKVMINAGSLNGLYIRNNDDSPYPLIMVNDACYPAYATACFITNDGFFYMTNRLFGGSYAILNSTGNWSASSDERLKTDVTCSEGLLDAAMKLRPVDFRWKSTGETGFGLIAQEVREVLPNLVVGDEGKGMLGVTYPQLSVVAVGAVRELKERHDAEIAALKRQNEALQARLRAVETALQKISAGH